MRKTIFTLFGVLFITLTLTSFKKPNTVPRKAIRTIVIDPGHGGLDPGARGLISTEAEVSLEVAMKLGKLIQREFPDIKIVYTRTTDVLAGHKPDKDAANRYRADLANDSGGDLFIAIHCNSAGRAPGGWYGQRISRYNYVEKKVKVKKKWVTKNVKVPVYEKYW